MKRRAHFVCAGILLCGSLLAAISPARGDAKADELAKLKGNWVGVSLDIGQGQDKQFLLNRPLTLIFDGDTLTAVEGGAATQPSTRPATRPAEVAKITAIDASAKPASLDFKPSDIGGTIHAIYRLNGDSLELCFGKDPDAPRPTEFKGGGNAVSFMLKREK